MNLNHYKNSKKEIVALVFRQKGMDILQAVSFVSVCNHYPIIATLFFVGEELDWPEEILENIEMIKRVYSYTKIEGIPESYPGRK